MLFLLGLTPSKDMGKSDSPESLFWKIEYEEKVSWLFGTIHISLPEFEKIPEAIKNALRNSDLFVSEMEPDEKNQVEVMNGMLLPDSETLSVLIGNQRFSRLTDILEMNEMPVSIELLNKHKVWAAALLIAWPRKSDDIPFDMLLFEKAKLSGIKTMGLESPKEQLEIFDSFTLSEQIEILEDGMKEADEKYANLNLLIKKYLSQDLSGLSELFYSKKTFFSPEFREKYLNVMLIKRNHHFLKHLLPAIKKGRAFIAVGAGHLTGNEGLISLLKKRGCSLEPVNFKFEKTGLPFELDILVPD